LTLVVAAAHPVLPTGAQESKPLDARAGTAMDSGRTLTPLVVVGFRADEKLDARDAWIPTAVEETLAWRLRRVPGLIVVPTVRTHQARQELVEKEGDPLAEWSRVVRLLGAKLWLQGTCAGTPDALILNLELNPVGRADAEPTAAQLGPRRLFEVVDEATRWALSRLGRLRWSTTPRRFWRRGVQTCATGRTTSSAPSNTTPRFARHLC